MIKSMAMAYILGSLGEFFITFKGLMAESMMDFGRMGNSMERASTTYWMGVGGTVYGKMEKDSSGLMKKTQPNDIAFYFYFFFYIISFLYFNYYLS